MEITMDTPEDPAMPLALFRTFLVVALLLCSLGGFALDAEIEVRDTQRPDVAQLYVAEACIDADALDSGADPYVELRKQHASEYRERHRRYMGSSQHWLLPDDTPRFTRII